MWRGVFNRRDPLDVIEKVDRQRFYQNYRLFVGCYVHPDLHCLSGALLLVQGAGRWLRCRPLHFQQLALPDSIGELASRILVSPSSISSEPRDSRQSESPTQPYVDALALRDVQLDMTECLCQLLGRIKQAAGKSADRILACGVTHGTELYSQSFAFESADSARPLQADDLLDAERLAEHSGLTIVSDFSRRDQAAGGRGAPVGALPLWLLLADRQEPVARHRRLLILKDEALVVGLPASDGIDDEYPAIVWCKANAAEPHRRTLPSAASSTEGQFQAGNTQPPSNSLANSLADLERLYRQCVESMGAVGEVYHCGLESTAGSSWPPADPAWMGCPFQCGRSDPWSLQLGEQGTPAATDRLACISAAESGPAMAALSGAMLALMHLDQMPGSLPWLTGAQAPRILGRITPGNPANWRRVLMNMADYRPPAMRLKDAI